jgi:Domain of unknown function (DUF4345)
VSRVVLVFLGLTVFGFGLAFTLRPIEMAQVVDISLFTPTARTDFRAVYGGFELGFGLFLLTCAVRRHLVRVGLQAAAWVALGTATARLIGMLADGFGVLMIVMFLVETMAGALALWASFTAPPMPRPEVPSTSPAPTTPGATE